MPRHEEQATLGYGADELFAVVADVKDYPLFVPWCSGAPIHREDQHEIIADAAFLTDQSKRLRNPAQAPSAGDRSTRSRFGISVSSRGGTPIMSLAPLP